MFLRAKTRFKDGKEHRDFRIVESRRTAGGRVVQRHVLYLGEINDSQKAAWCKSIEAFDESGVCPQQLALFPEDRVAPPLDCEVVQVKLNQKDYLDFVETLDLYDIRFIPLSALNGANVIHRSEAMPWFEGLLLMELLSTLEIASDLRFPVQWVNRPHLNFRGFSGTLAAGISRPGDPAMALPSRKTSRVKAIVT